MFGKSDDVIFKLILVCFILRFVCEVVTFHEFFIKSVLFPS